MANDLYSIPDGFDKEQFPYTVKYIMLYGAHKLLSEWDVKAPYKDREEVLKECYERETTWEELLNFKGYDPNVIY